MGFKAEVEDPYNGKSFIEYLQCVSLFAKMGRHCLAIQKLAISYLVWRDTVSDLC